VTQTSGPAPGMVNAPGTYVVSYEANDACGTTETCSFTVTVEDCSTQLCDAGGLQSNFGYIDQVVFGDINNVSGDNGGYEDFTNLCSNIEPGQFVPVQFHPGFGGGKSHTMYWTCWIDYNQDGDFYDNLEFVAYGAGPSMINGGITIPPSVINGTCSMRVTTKLGGYAADPCGSYLFGETEDYCITVINGNVAGVEPVSRRDKEDSPVELTTATEIESSVTDTEISDENEWITDSEVSEAEESEIIEPLRELDVKIYPNPVSHFMNVELNHTESVSEINLYDQGGRKVVSVEKSIRSRTDVSNLEGGMYLLQIIKTDGSMTTKKVIIMH